MLLLLLAAMLKPIETCVGELQLQSLNEIARRSGRRLHYTYVRLGKAHRHRRFRHDLIALISAVRHTLHVTIIVVAG